uniref:DUF4246 domain-containing protein n=1 Tax=Lotharella oceanica TaxID=641309 RepID=A0A7S2TEU2_9EUKA
MAKAAWRQVQTNQLLIHAPAVFNPNRSSQYQWLPAEFRVDPYGKAKIESYITGLHPKQHQGLYRDLEGIFERFVPLFERTLTAVTCPFPEKTDTRCPQFQDHWGGAVMQPKVQPFKPPKTTPVILRGRRLQVIVKIGATIIRPRDGSFRGGSWHVEGMENEGIVATGIYYYDQENISKTTLAFRRSIADPPYEQNDDRGVQEVYSLRNDQEMNEPLGSIDCLEGRCVTFPNIFQHRVAPFELADKTRPGHRKILVFFLVDPFKRLYLSTSRVPPTDPLWLLEPADRVLEAVTKLPPDVRRLVFAYQPFFGFGMTADQAKAHRLQLMKERTFIESRLGGEFFERNFSLCEH